MSSLQWRPYYMQMCSIVYSFYHIANIFSYLLLYCFVAQCSFWFLGGWSIGYVYPCSAAVDDIFWSLIYLTLHLHGLFLLVRYFNPQNTKIRATQIQSNEISLFCKRIKMIDILQILFNIIKSLPLVIIFHKNRTFLRTTVQFSSPSSQFVVTTWKKTTNTLKI